MGQHIEARQDAVQVAPEARELHMPRQQRIGLHPLPNRLDERALAEQQHVSLRVLRQHCWQGIEQRRMALAIDELCGHADRQGIVGEAELAELLAGRLP